MKSPIVLLFCLVAVVVDGRPEPPVSSYLPSSYTTTQQDSFSPPSAGLSNTYGAPSAPSNSYGVPSSLSNRYGAQSALSNSYGVPSTPSVFSNTYASSSAPSISYGAPSAPSRGAGSRAGFSSHRSRGSKSRFGGSAPSQIYGSPAHTSAIFTPSFTDGALSSTYGAPAFEGYSPSKYDASQNDLAEPAMYEFSYQVEDAASGSDFGHREEREGGSAWGTYEVLLPDGRKQIVEYQADQNGYNPKIRYEQTGYAASRGAGGPY